MADSVVVDPDDSSKEIVTLVLPVGSIAGVFGDVSQLKNQVLQQVTAQFRNKMLDFYIPLSLDQLHIADAAARAALASEE